MKRKLLVVEDEQDIAELLALHLRDLGHDVTLADDGHSGLRLACSKQWDLILLDLRLPGVPGLDICRALRKNNAYVPILMLTSKSTELDRVLGLELGADDYVTKPFSVLELMARVKAILRRTDARRQSAGGKESLLAVGDVTIDTNSRTAAIGSQAIDLTAREFELLAHFLRYPGQVFRRSELLDQVWGYGHDGYEHTVNSHINRLRSKIESDPARPTRIVTVWGVGYKMEKCALQAAT